MKNFPTDKELNTAFEQQEFDEEGMEIEEVCGYRVGVEDGWFAAVRHFKILHFGEEFVKQEESILEGKIVKAIGEHEIEEINNNVQLIVSNGIEFAKGDEEQWKAIFDCVFSNSHRLKELGVKLDYCDPDTSYEEDVKAFAQALNSYVEEHFK